MLEILTFQKVFKNRNPSKIRKRHILGHSKGFQEHATFSTETSGLYSNQNNLSLKQPKTLLEFEISYYARCFETISFIFWASMFQLWHTVKTCSPTCTNKLFPSSSFSCLPIKGCEPEVYAKHIVQLWDAHCICLSFGATRVLVCS